MSVPETRYDNRFYENQSRDSYRAATIMLPKVFEILAPTSVVDVGCGVGTWLAAARELGAESVVGYEGEWVEEHMLRDAAIDLRRQDLERPIVSETRFDLAMSLEVAEHLSPGRAESLIDELCGLSEHVLFGAAVPGQGGVNHINEQWQAYWIGLFEERGYKHLDVIRPTFWGDSSLPIHYRQNTFLYLSPGAYRRVTETFPGADEPTRWPTDLVHPEMHLNNMAAWSAPPTLPEVLRTVAYLPLALLRSVRARI